MLKITNFSFIIFLKFLVVWRVMFILNWKIYSWYISLNHIITQNLNFKITMTFFFFLNVSEVDLTCVELVI